MKRRINITIEESLLKALDRQLRRLKKEEFINLTRSALIERLLADWVKKQKEG